MNNTKPTIKQKKAFKNTVENGGNKSKAFKEAGYSDAIAKNPSRITESKGWEQLLEEYLPDELLTKVHLEGLMADKREGQTDKPDMPTRHKYLNTAYQLKAKFEKDNAQKAGDINIHLSEKKRNKDIFKDLIHDKEETSRGKDRLCSKQGNKGSKA